MAKTIVVDVESFASTANDPGQLCHDHRIAFNEKIMPETLFDRRLVDDPDDPDEVETAQECAADPEVRFLTALGHGSPDALHASTAGTYLWTRDQIVEAALKVGAKMVHFLACSTGFDDGLGEALVDSGVEAFFGYKNLFVLHDPSPEAGQSDPDVAKPSLEFDSQVDQLLSEGKMSAEEIAKTVISQARKTINQLLEQGRCDAAAALEHNARCFIAQIGDKTITWEDIPMANDGDKVALGGAPEDESKTKAPSAAKNLLPDKAPPPTGDTAKVAADDQPQDAGEAKPKVRKGILFFVADIYDAMYNAGDLLPSFVKKPEEVMKPYGLTPPERCALASWDREVIAAAVADWINDHDPFATPSLWPDPILAIDSITPDQVNNAHNQKLVVGVRGAVKGCEIRLVPLPPGQVIVNGKVTGVKDPLEPGEVTALFDLMGVPPGSYEVELRNCQNHAWVNSHTVRVTVT